MMNMRRRFEGTLLSPTGSWSFVASKVSPSQWYLHPVDPLHPPHIHMERASSGIMAAHPGFATSIESTPDFIPIPIIFLDYGQFPPCQDMSSFQFLWPLTEKTVSPQVIPQLYSKLPIVVARIQCHVYTDVKARHAFTPSQTVSRTGQIDSSTDFVPTSSC
ncbi:hypothetical protein BDN72DRAFT_115958 [Pluteus cervinus]|uniref:Uncharacterized protein n=1 Tax=Pluteus cervinus TaxID=181527 RepID=A0ACD3AP37_9AGAR|nr:hypothetical protein BDN72DRAFT_115958 [Pluteus cervinus]